MKFSPCSWLRIVRGLSPQERIDEWASEVVATQRQVQDLTLRVGELEVAVARTFTKPEPVEQLLTNEQAKQLARSLRDFGEYVDTCREAPRGQLTRRHMEEMFVACLQDAGVRPKEPAC